ncbi:MAG: membrane protein insertase YidC, partial [Cyanobacteria bacterium P01_D01_bin.73]
MVLFFGVSLYVNQIISGGQGGGNPQQAMVGKITPVLFSGMFLFFPLPAGVLMYMTIANVFQTAQTFIVSRESLPENIQKMADAQALEVSATAVGGGSVSTRDTLPFEPTGSKKKKRKKAES